ncbi:MAG TPA: lytic transglycosylase domain-containing protein [Vicinamibacterales bacterium]
MTPRLFGIAIAVGVLLQAVSARADIYAWRDANGRLVISDRPARAGNTDVSYAVGGNDAIRTTVRADAIHPSTRAAIEAIVERQAAQHAVNPDLVRAVIQVESAWNPYAVSSKGAMGLMQLMPATARELGVTDPFDPAQNIRGGVRYLKRLLERYDGNAELALAAYNAGPGAVDRYGRIPPYRETQNYVRKIKSVTEIRVGPRRVIYKVVEIINGREVPRYSDRKPEGDYEVVTRR